MKIAFIGSSNNIHPESTLRSEALRRLGKASVVGIIGDHQGAPIFKAAQKYELNRSIIKISDTLSHIDEETERLYINILKEWNADFVILSDFNIPFKISFIKKFYPRIIRIHSSLLPAFPQKEPLKSALEFGSKVIGSTVHWVTTATNSGPVIDQISLLIEPNDTFEDLQLKVNQAEQLLLPKVVARISQIL